MLTASPIRRRSRNAESTGSWIPVPKKHTAQLSIKDTLQNILKNKKKRKVLNIAFKVNYKLT